MDICMYMYIYIGYVMICICSILGDGFYDSLYVHGKFINGLVTWQTHANAIINLPFGDDK